MSLERTKHDPAVAEKLRQIKEANSKTTPQLPIETVAINSLRELSGAISEIKEEKKDLVQTSLELAIENGQFITETMLLLPNLDKLLKRTDGKISFNWRKTFYYGKLPIEELGYEDYEREIPSLCYLDKDFSYKFFSRDDFQIAWDRGGEKVRKTIANFGRMNKKQILNRFVNFARQQAQTQY